MIINLNGLGCDKGASLGTDRLSRACYVLRFIYLRTRLSVQVHLSTYIKFSHALHII